MMNIKRNKKNGKKREERVEAMRSGMKIFHAYIKEDVAEI